jgi:hypothetical protein
LNSCPGLRSPTPQIFRGLARGALHPRNGEGKVKLYYTTQRIFKGGYSELAFKKTEVDLAPDTYW